MNQQLSRREIVGARTTLLFLIAAVVTVAGPASAASTKNSIRSVDFRNFEWETLSGEPIVAKNGVADRGNNEDGDLLHFEVLDVDHGDIDGDGEEEAIVSTLENTGGTGQFTDAVVFRLTGKGPVRVTSHGIGDRADGGLKGVVIVGGVAQIERYTKGLGACCPTVLSTYFVKLRGDKLVTARPTTQRATMMLGSGADVPKTKIQFLKGTASANVSGSASDRDGGYFDAKKGQTVNFRVLKADRDSLAGAVQLHQNGSKIGEVRQGLTGSFKLPVSGRYEVGLSQVQPSSDPNSYSWVEFEISIK